MASLVAPGRKKRRPNFSPEFKKALAQQAWNLASRFRSLRKRMAFAPVFGLSVEIVK
jgi:hypothetical protein